jgi:hypothetical protein
MLSSKRELQLQGAFVLFGGFKAAHQIVSPYLVSSSLSRPLQSMNQCLHLPLTACIPSLQILLLLTLLALLFLAVLLRIELLPQPVLLVFFASFCAPSPYSSHHAALLPSL